MAFTLRKRAGKYIKTGMDLCECGVLEQEDLETLVSALQLGNATVVKPIILTHIRLAIHIAGQYAYTPSSGPDLVSVALTALCDGCQRVLGGKPLTGDDCNITGYLICLIHSRCNRFNCENRTIRVPLSSLIKARKEGLKINLPRTKELKSAANRYRESTNISEVYEEIMACCTCDREIYIIRLREQCYNNAEIGVLLHLTPVRIGQILHSIEDRFNQR